MDLVKDFLIPGLTFIAGLFGGLWPHVQRPLTEYRQTLTDISKLMLRSVPTMYGDGRRTDRTTEAEIHNEQLIKFYDDVRMLHARLMSSADSIPRFARPVLQLLELLRLRDQIEVGAKMLIGISNQVLSAHTSRI
jgi:hypothetical protein